MLSKGQWKIAIVYTVLQLVIWVKTVLYFLQYGGGRVADFSLAAFPAEAVLWDFVFHEAMHVSIGILALLFGARIKRIEWPKLVVIVFIAVAVHNFAYWLTASHPSIGISAIDFARDCVILLAFILAGFAFNKVLRGRTRGRKV